MIPSDTTINTNEHLTATHRKMNRIIHREHHKKTELGRNIYRYWRECINREIDKLKEKGWSVGSTQEFLNLSNAEMQMVELDSDS